MEAMKLLTVALAVLLVSLTAYLRRSRLFYTPRPMPTILVGDPDVTRRLLIDHADAFSDHPILPLGIDLDAGHPSTTSITSAPHGPFWRALRRNLTVNILHPSRVGALQVPLQRRAVEALVAGLSSAVGPDGGEVEVRDAIYAAVFATVARLCVGEDGDGGLGERDVGAMRSLLRDFFHSDVGPTLLLTSRWARLVHWRKWRQLVGLRGRLAEVFGPAIAARRLSRGRRGDADGDGGGGGGACGSYLDALIDVRVPAGCDDSDGGDARRELRDDEIVKLMWEFLGASTEAVVASVEWTLARLVAEPEVQEKLHRGLTGGDRRNGQVPPEERLRDTPYLRAVVLESLRLHPPLPMLIRDVGPEGAAAAGFAPPPPPDGSLTRFLFNAEVIGRDAKAWTDPDEFRPERFLAGGEGEDVGPVPGLKEIKMVPFRAGRRHCPGAGLSMVHVGGIVAALVREFEWAPPAGGGGGGVDLKAVTALFVRVMASPLRARVTPRLAPS